MPPDAKDLWVAIIIASQPWLVDAVAMAAAYALGSIPFGYIFSRFAGLGDIRKIGSGNIGATNVLRTGRKGLALITLACDAAKGFLPVFLCKTFIGPDAALFAALGAFAGHLFPVWLNFRGGKGVATYIGILLGVYWQAGIFFCAIWLCIALISRYSSLSALVAAALTPLLLLTQASYQLFILVLALSTLLIARHHNNIRNLITGHERKIGERPS